MKRALAPLLAGSAVALAIACGDEGTTAPGGALTEVQPDCLECMRTLTECTSTAKNERQFSECRDVFGACQDKMGLGPRDCGRPNNQQACELCRDRLDDCAVGKAPEAKDCALEFSVCKTFLMSRDQDSCQPEGEAPGGTCATCVDALAACAFGGDASSVCESTFFACRNTNLVEPAECPGPSVGEACDACLEQHDACAAAGGEDCPAGWAACVGVLASEGACGAGPSEGQGGGGEGGGSSGPTCPHDACETGAAMSAECDACIAEVCAGDSFCCDTEYDAYCVERAATVPACGCEAPSTCGHEPCVTGDWLQPDCDPCVTTVCEADGFCCNTTWDELCIERAVELCGLSCG